MSSGYKLDKILFNPQILPLTKLNKILSNYNFNGQIIELNNSVYSKIAYREKTEGIIGIANWKTHTLNYIKLSNVPILLIAENIEKPGNIGAMIRTVDAAGIDAFIIANPITDIYNPNIIRSSVGGIFSTQIAISTTQKIIEWLRNKNITLYTATLQNSFPYYKINFREPVAIAVGNEAKGIDKSFRKAAKKNIIIPMHGKLDSLNVSISAAIIIFEAIRQRKLQ